MTSACPRFIKYIFIRGSSLFMRFWLRNCIELICNRRGMDMAHAWKGKRKGHATPKACLLHQIDITSGPYSILFFLPYSIFIFFLGINISFICDTVSRRCLFMDIFVHTHHTCVNVDDKQNAKICVANFYQKSTLSQWREG